jgi:hypothetical protein
VLLAAWSVQTGFAVPGIDESERHVPLVLSRPVGTRYPTLAGNLATNIEQRLDQPV